MPRSLQNVVFVLLAGLGWGLLGAATKVLYALEPATFDGITISVARAAWALPIFLVILVVAWRASPPRLDPKRWVAVIAASLVFGWLVVAVFTIAVEYTSLSHISFLYGLSPVLNTAAAALVFRTALDRRQWTALALGIAGVAILASTHSSYRSGFIGDLLMLGWLCAFAVYAVLLRIVGTRMNGVLTMALVGTISMTSLLVPAVALGHGRAIAHVADTPAIAWWFFGEIVLGSMVISQTAYAASVRRLGISVATIGAEYIALAIGVVMSLVMHEAWTPLTVVGGLILCCALAVTFVPVPRFLKLASEPRT